MVINAFQLLIIAKMVIFNQKIAVFLATAPDFANLALQKILLPVLLMTAGANIFL